MEILKAAGLNPLVDTRGRIINYMRLSITDRCNLRCAYCVPHVGGLEFIPHERILSYEEALRLVKIAVSFGVQKVRLTGGEPFVRKGLMGFVRGLRERFPDLILAITTNATMLRPHVAELKALGLNSLNISLDTFRPAVFRKITGTDLYPEVRMALEAALESGLRVKLNAVGLRGINDGELPDFLEFARRNPVDFRIIEYMPMGGRTKWSDDNFWPAESILDEAGNHADLTPLERLHEPANLNGPARLYSIGGGKGRFGIITPVSQHFCSSCNRLRVTSDGKLRTCLFSDREYSLRPMLRDPRITDAHIYRVFAGANQSKPLGTELLEQRARREQVIRRTMTSIGG